jgi:hypothetical protein
VRDSCKDNLAAGGEVVELADRDDVLDMIDDVIPTRDPGSGSISAINSR